MNFSLSKGVSNKQGFTVPGSMDVTPRAQQRSMERLQDRQQLLLKRQNYEETLGIYRKHMHDGSSGFYRITQEPVAPRYSMVPKDMRCFIWPLPPGRHTPLEFPVPKNAGEANQLTGLLQRMNLELSPFVSEVWWTPSRR